MFCRKCGKSIPSDSRFCPSCGASVDGHLSANDTVTNSDKFRLTIDRASQVYLINPPVKVTIDNSIRFSVENGQTYSIDISAGSHTILFKSSIRSTTLNVDITRDTLIILKWNRITGKLMAEIV